MRVDVERLMSDSGDLVGASGVPGPAGRWTAVALQFAAGTLLLTCDDDTDEVVASVDRPLPATGVPVEALADLVGMTVDYAWELRNHRGYTDAFQLRFADRRGREETRQFEVAASAIDLRRVE